MAQSNNRTYSIDLNGIIFTEDVAVFTDDTSGAVLARGNPHRTPYTPDIDPTTLTDATIKALAAVAWTPAVVAAYKAALTASKT